MKNSFAFSICAAVLATGTAQAGFTLIKDDFTAWSGQAGAFTTIGFNDLPNNTLVTDQYCGLGVTFTDPDPNVIQAPNLFSIYPQDGAGLNGVCLIEMAFSQPLDAIAWHFPGIIFAELYSGDTLLYQSPLLGNSGLNWFAGLVSDTAFDRVRIHGEPPDQYGQCHYVFLDNLYFSTVPAPPVLALLGLAGVLAHSRRRSRAGSPESRKHLRAASWRSGRRRSL
ncbi:MAG: hypothetical protein U0572_17190 [Phycisphaerales bacterium]